MSPLPPVWQSWINVALLFGALLLLKAVARFLFRPHLRYHSREHLLSKGEGRFLQALERAVPDGVRICPQVRLWDVIDAPKNRLWREATNKIRAKHLDFVLVDASTSRILGAVELDDRSHNRADRQESDRFKDDALAQAKIPLVRVRTARSYSPGALRESLDHVLDAYRAAA